MGQRSIADTLRAARAMLHEAPDDEIAVARGTFLANELVELGGDAHIGEAFKMLPAFIAGLLVRNVGYVTQDLGNIFTLVHRLERTTTRAMADGDDGLWRAYVALDIEHFHVEVRSALDYMAICIGAAAGRPKQLPTSFRQLSEGVDTYRTRLGPELARVVESAPWFPELRDVRDGVTHGGSMALVFGSPADGILFQVLGSGLRGHVAEESVMWNENVADFRKYSALVLSRLLVFLDDAAGGIRTAVPQLKRAGMSGRIYCPGLALVRDWIDAYASAIENRSR